MLRVAEDGGGDLEDRGGVGGGEGGEGEAVLRVGLVWCLPLGVFE